VPDNVLNPLISALHADPHFATFCCTREEEAVGIAAGAWMGGMPGVVLMQTSGFATLPNVLASLVVPFQIPVLMIISERGTLGEFNLGQVMVCRTMHPALKKKNYRTGSRILKRQRKRRMSRKGWPPGFRIAVTPQSRKAG
jgi:sulfopyruvate decarboxylase TPP-binding subunit